MKLKAKLISTIASFCLVLGFVITGIWAAGTGVVNIGGSVGFIAEDVYVKVTGSVVDAQETIQLNELIFSAAGEPSEADRATWTNNELTFKNKSTPIKYNITIKNLSDERKTSFKIIDNFDEEENLSKIMKIDEGTVNEEIYAEERIELDVLEEKQ